MGVLREGAIIIETMNAANGRGRQKKALMHGISPFEERAGVAEWQTSRVPISACLS
jgi:hypothetical protein